MGAATGCPTPAITVSPARGASGTVVTVTGKSFWPPRSSGLGGVTIDFTSTASWQNPAAAMVDSAGDFTAKIAVASEDVVGSNPISATEQTACGAGGAVTYITATAPFTVLPPLWYRGQVGNGAEFALKKVTNESIEDLPDATLVGTIVFRTDDSYYAALDGHALDVWSAPKEFPGELVVHNGDQGSQPVYGTWVYTPSYSAEWNGKVEHLSLVPNESVEALPDAVLQGQVTGFATTNPYYRCLAGASLDTWTAPAEFPGELVVHNGDQGSQCTYLTATFAA
jgi:hypothetical protein